MITTTIKIDAADTMTICRIKACAWQFRETADLLAHYAEQAEDGATPYDLERPIENAIGAGVMLAVKAFGGTVSQTTICQPATKS